ncbi:MAG: hypothetical protein A2287_03555 [Candidatus Melainabacteria bacterium RIFOXYA12_FULL_32_12]|nr:MAG: hypothetical protein A2255_10900 [Candidatus Melainabacteria bacterium RIFOXYA2_FULL_32_9]OGI30083.1 MAG: hypothetical protein A2287_03555 [Candidatus Melainabacteria bacterium RIFOXYA12_FULL_32_12]
MNINSTKIPAQPHLNRVPISFKGDKDILVIDDSDCGINSTIQDVKSALGSKADGYNIHAAKGGKVLKKQKMSNLSSQ